MYIPYMYIICSILSTNRTNTNQSPAICFQVSPRLLQTLKFIVEIALKKKPTSMAPRTITQNVRYLSLLNNPSL